MQKNGLNYLHAPDDAYDEWKKMVTTFMYPEILEKEVPEELYLRVEQLLADFRAGNKE